MSGLGKTENLQLWLVVVASLTMVSFALWIPTGIHIPVVYEEWWARALHDIHGEAARITLLIDTFLKNELNSRPTVLWPSAIAYWITPDSFLGNYVLHSVIILCKGVVFFYLLQKFFPENTLLIFFCVVLFLVYPSDTAVFSLRATHIHSSILFYLLSVSFLVLYWERQKFAYVILMWVCQAVGLLMYEATYPLVFFTPLALLWWKQNFTRRFFVTSFYWYVVPASIAMYASYLVLRSNTLQSGRLNADIQLIEVMNTLMMGYKKNLIYCWQVAVEQLKIGESGFSGLFQRNSFSVVLVVISVALGAWYIDSKQANKQASTGRYANGTSQGYWKLALLGLITVGLGYVPFSITVVADQDFRVYLVSSIGASVFIAVTIYMLMQHIVPKYRDVLFATSMCLLVGIASSSHLRWIGEWTEVSLQEQSVLIEIIEQAPKIKQPVYVIVDSPNSESSQLWAPHYFVFPWIFAAALSYMYDDYDLMLGGAFCKSPVTCKYDEIGISVLRHNRPIYPLTFSYDQVLIFDSENLRLYQSVPEALYSGKEAEKYKPFEIIDSNSAPPERVNSVFENGLESTK